VRATAPQAAYENRIERCRAKTSTEANVARHLCVLAHLVTKHNITAKQLSNWDKTEFSLAAMAVSRSEVLVDTEAGRSLSWGMSVGK